VEGRHPMESTCIHLYLFVVSLKFFSTAKTVATAGNDRMTNEQLVGKNVERNYGGTSSKAHGGSA
jgi:hypothetical protein